MVIQAIICQFLLTMETNDYGTVTTYSVAFDGPPFGDEETFNDPFAMPHSPDLA